MAQVLIDDREARKTVMQLEIRNDPGCTISHACGDKGFAGTGDSVEHFFRRILCRRAKFDVARGNHLAGNAGDPVRREGGQRGRVGAVTGNAAAEEGVAGELGVPFPFQAQGASVEHPVVAIDNRAGFGTEGRAELRQMCTLVGGTAAGVGDGQIADPLRPWDGNRRARVDLRIEAMAQGVFGKWQHHGVKKENGTECSTRCRL